MPSKSPLIWLQLPQGSGEEPRSPPRLSPALLGLGDGVGAALAVIFGHILALLEGGRLVLQHVSDAEGVAVETPLLAQFGAI